MADPDDDNIVWCFRHWVHHLRAENRKLYGTPPVTWSLRFYGTLPASGTSYPPNVSNSVAVGMKTQNHSATETIHQGITEQSSSHWPPSPWVSIKGHPAPQPSRSRSRDVQPSTTPYIGICCSRRGTSNLGRIENMAPANDGDEQTLNENTVSAVN
jgi:hypothetical protein